MDALQSSITGLMDIFNKRMAVFEDDLEKTKSTTTATSPNTTALAAEFVSFREFVVNSFHAIQLQLRMLAQNVDNMEMRGRRNILLLHGVTEEKDEDTATLALQLIVNKLKQSNFSAQDIKRCHRMGRAASDRPRPILVKLCSAECRNAIWFNKTGLRGSGVTLSEFLTKDRHNIFVAARQKVGVAKCWTRDGVIWLLGPDGNRVRITSLADLDKIPHHDATKPPTTAKQSASASSAVAGTSRPKRGITSKK